MTIPEALDTYTLWDWYWQLYRMMLVTYVSYIVLAVAVRAFNDR